MPYQKKFLENLEKTHLKGTFSLGPNNPRLVNLKIINPYNFQFYYEEVYQLLFQT
jgi:hypothetical protein